MKHSRLNLFLSFTLLLSVYLYVLNSCRAVTECKTCNTTADEKVVVKFDRSLGEQSVLSNVWHGNIIMPNYDCAEPADDKKFDFEKLKSVVESEFHCKPVMGNIILSYVLYLKNQMHEGNTISSSDLYGIGIYSFKQNKLYHQFYEKEGESFIEVDNLNSKVDGLSTTIINVIMKQVVKPVGPSTSFILVSPSNFKLIKNVDSKDELLKKINSNYSASRNQSSRTLTDTLMSRFIEPAEDPDAICNPQCTYHQWSTCYKNDFNQYKCQGSLSPCPVFRAYNEVRNNNYWSDDSMYITVHPEVLYDFRDNILPKTSLGQRYVDDYYYLGELFADSINLSRALMMLREMPEVYTILDNIQHGGDNDIVYGTTVRNKILTILNYVKGLTSDSHAQDKIDSLISDVNYYSGKYASVFRADLSY